MSRDERTGVEGEEGYQGGNLPALPLFQSRILSF